MLQLLVLPRWPQPGRRGAKPIYNNIWYIIRRTYDNITLKLTDSHENESNTLTVSSFTIDTTPPQISQVTPVFTNK